MYQAHAFQKMDRVKSSNWPFNLGLDMRPPLGDAVAPTQANLD